MAPPRIADGPNLAGNDLAKTKTAKPPEYCGVFGSYRRACPGATPRFHPDFRRPRSGDLV